MTQFNIGEVAVPLSIELNLPHSRGKEITAEDEALALTAFLYQVVTQSPSISRDVLEILQERIDAILEDPDLLKPKAPP